MARFEVKFISYTLKRSVDLTVVIPSVTVPESFGMDGKTPSHAVGDKYPVLYLLHGMGNHHGDWTSYSNVEFFAEERNIAVVMISGENKFYKCTADGDDFFAFLNKEVPEFVTNMFPISDRKEDSFIAGLSMGGYGALLHGMNRPDRYAAIGAFSAAVGVVPNTTQADGDVVYDMEKLAEAEMPPIYLACGTEDMLYQANLQFRDILKNAGRDVTWIEEEGYGHEWRFWNRQVEEFLKWIPRTDSYAELGVRKI